MPSIHGSKTVLSVQAPGVTGTITGITSSAITRGNDSHDVTAYGSLGHEYVYGLENNTFTMQGWYDSTTSTGNIAMLNTINDAKYTALITRRPLGTGVGLPQEKFNAQITSFVQTNPVADIVTYQVDWQISGLIVNSTQ